MIDFFDTEMALQDAKAIAWDECHKIYVLMDDKQVEQMREYGYDTLITKDEKSAREMLAIIKDWFERSCFLRFVEAVSTVEEGKDPNEGFETLIEQGASDEEECDECGELGCAGACEDYEDEDEDEDEEDEE